MVEKLFPDTFLKNYNWAYLWISSLKFHTVCFYCVPSWGLLKYIESKLQTTWFYLISSVFWKTGLELASLPHFCMIFEEKYFSCYILLTDQISLSGCINFVRYWTVRVLQLFFNQVVTPLILKLTLCFQLTRFFYRAKKSRQKFKYLDIEKSS